MGCDGGTIPKRHELVKGPKKVEKVCWFFWFPQRRVVSCEAVLLENTMSIANVRQQLKWGRDHQKLTLALTFTTEKCSLCCSLYSFDCLAQHIVSCRELWLVCYAFSFGLANWFNSGLTIRLFRYKNKIVILPFNIEHVLCVPFPSRWIKMRRWWLNGNTAL